MTQKTDEPHSIWLLPDTDTSNEVRRVIECLAKLQETPVFEPHVTLLGDLTARIKNTAQQCEAAFAGVGQISARVTNVGRSDAHFMSLYLEVSLPSQIIDIRDSLSMKLSREKPSHFLAHISLAYGPLRKDMDEAELRTQIDKLCHRGIVLDRATVIRSAKEIPLDDWAIYSEISL